MWTEKQKWSTVHENELTVRNHQGTANQNHHELFLHPCQSSCSSRRPETTSIGKNTCHCRVRGTLVLVLVGMQIATATMENSMEGASLLAQSVKNPAAMQESTCYAGDRGSIPRSGRSPGEGNGNPLQHSCLENPMDRGAWQGGLQSMGSQESDRTQRLNHHHHTKNRTVI